jgi:hypothetical protein
MQPKNDDALKFETGNYETVRRHCYLEFIADSGASGGYRNWRLRNAYVLSWASAAASAL